MGAHLAQCEGVPGVRFAVWAPNAEVVSVGRRFQRLGYPPPSHAPAHRRRLGDLSFPAGEGAHYKYQVRSRFQGYNQQKADPYGFEIEVPPKSASVVCDHRLQWHDADWMEQRAEQGSLEGAGFDLRSASGILAARPGQYLLTYRELAAQLVEYVKRLGYTHIEFLPIRSILFPVPGAIR